MKILNSVLAVCAALLIFVQCAETEGENYDEREQVVFDQWMKTNHPEAEKLDNGMYMEWFRRNTSASKLATDDYMYVDYLGRDLNGNIFSNRDSARAVDEGTFTRYTHYTPHYAIFNKEAYYFTEGEYEALAMMNKGDSVRLYLPSMLAYRTTGVSSSTYFAYGYEGWYNSSTNPKNVIGTSSNLPSMSGKPVIIDLALRDIVSKPEDRELSDAIAAASALGYNVQDTIRKGMFFKYAEDDPENEIVGEDKESGLIAEDSTVYIVYALRFLDDFLIATNDAGTAYDGWGDFWTSYSPIQVGSSSSLLKNSGSTHYISAINELVKSKRMRYNSRAQIIFVSTWAYGYAGDPAAATKPAVYPYTPLKMDIITLKYGYDPTADEEEEEEPEG